MTRQHPGKDQEMLAAQEDFGLKVLQFLVAMAAAGAGMQRLTDTSEMKEK